MNAILQHTYRNAQDLDESRVILDVHHILPIIIFTSCGLLASIIAFATEAHNHFKKHINLALK